MESLLPLYQTAMQLSQVIFVQNYFATLTKLNMTSKYHPQIDDQTEFINKCLETYLHCFTSEQQHQWEKWLPLTEWWYDSSYHTASKMTPYEAVYGQALLVILP